MMRSQRTISMEPSRSTSRILTWLPKLISRLRRTPRNSSVNELKVSISQHLFEEWPLMFLFHDLDLGLTTAQAMTLAQQLVNRERTKTQLIDEGFNRHTSMLGGDGLPSWFHDDEQKHFRNNIPVTKEAVAAIREKLRQLNARPIKKIAEAKARKAMRTIRRVEKARQKTNQINDDEENGYVTTFEKCTAGNLLILFLSLCSDLQRGRRQLVSPRFFPSRLVVLVHPSRRISSMLLVEVRTRTSRDDPRECLEDIRWWILG